MGSHESSNRRFPVSLPLQLLFMSIHHDQTAASQGIYTVVKLSSYKLIVSKQSQDKARGKKRRVAKVMLMKR